MKRARKVQQSLEPGREIHAIQRANLDEMQLESRRRNQPGLNAALGADKQHLRVVARTQLLRDGQRRNNMSAGSASSHDHTHG